MGGDDAMTTATARTAPASPPAAAGAPAHGNAYSIFILVLTVASLLVMVLLWLPFSPETLDLLRAYDNIICVVFLVDFGLSLARAPSKRAYFLGERGWLDLLGSIPSFRGAEALGIFRLARLSRLARILRLLRGQNKKALVDDIVHNRAQYAVLITVLAAYLVLAIASIVVLNAESRAASPNITTGWDAFWWAFVTITTVGYGDRYPTTVVGRIGAMFVMVLGIGIIGALASIMASLLVSPAPADAAAPPDAAAGASAGGEAALPSALRQELAALGDGLASVRHELAALRGVVERLEGRLDPAAPPAAPPAGASPRAGATDRAPPRGDQARP
jgi:voltage-gated potassium channel